MTSSITAPTDVQISVPDELDLSALRATGLQPGEEELPEGDAPGNQPQAQAGKLVT